MKPTPEEILRKAGYDEDAIFISYETVVKYMQEYAEQFHKEKLREELIKFAEWYDGDIIPKEPIVDKYLTPKE